MLKSIGLIAAWNLIPKRLRRQEPLLKNGMWDAWKTMGFLVKIAKKLAGVM